MLFRLLGPGGLLGNVCFRRGDLGCRSFYSQVAASAGILTLSVENILLPFLYYDTDVCLRFLGIFAFIDLKLCACRWFA